MPTRKMSRFNYWYIYQDLYMSALDRLTKCLQTIEIKQCICGFMDFYKNSMQFHPELINPDGSLKHQEVSVKSTKRAEVKPDVEKKRNGDTDGELIPINVDPVSKDTEIKDNAGDDDKDSASGPDISNHVKKLEHTENNTGVITKSHSNKVKITRKSSFRITSVIAFSYMREPLG